MFNRVAVKLAQIEQAYLTGCIDRVSARLGRLENKLASRLCRPVSIDTVAVAPLRSGG